MAVLFAGCAVGPEYQRPAALPSQPLPPAFEGGPATSTNAWKVTEPAAGLPRDAWWKLFGDPPLNRLEEIARSGNQDVAVAAARFDQARALGRVAGSDFFPHLATSPSASRQRTSFNAPLEGRVAGQSHTFNTFTVPMDLNWEIDLWGRIRRQVETARARLVASADDAESVRLIAEAELAADYFTLRALDEELGLVKDTIETYRRSLELTVNRRKGGIATDLDVAEAETQLRTTEAQLPALRLRRSRTLHALATLCGRTPTGFEWPAREGEAAGPGSLPEIPVTAPSQLLERRPDIAAAERRMAAANADIGVAQSAFYPRLQLSGLAGLQSVSADTLFDWPSRFWAVGPALQWPLFTGGRNRAQWEAARAAYEEALAQYRQTVLAAFQDVEDQLSAQQWLASQLDSETAALGAASRAVDVANNRYKAGLVTYLEVATAQSAALARERAVAQLRGEKLVAAVGLIKALGGGWSPPATK